MTPDEPDDLFVEIETPDPQEEPQAEPAEATPEPQEGAPEAAAEPVTDVKPKATSQEYSEKVQKRINRIWAKQQEALRRAEEAEARAAAAEARLAQMEPVARQAVGESIEAQIAAAEARAEELFNNGDTRGAIKATREAAALELKREWVNRTPQQEPRPQAQAQQVNEVPDAAHDWVRRNDWFNRDPVLTREAQRIEGSLISQGWDETDQEFYDEIDRQLAERFPGRAQPTRTEPAARPSPATASPVAPAGRAAPAPGATSRRPGQVRLDRDELAVARDLGLTPQQYEQGKLMRRGA